MSVAVAADNQLLRNYNAMLRSLMSITRLQMQDSSLHESEVIAYFDESGKLHDRAFVAYAGFAATAEQWFEFNRLWSGPLSGSGISCVSMKEAISYRGPFTGWKERVDERDHLLITLAEVIHRCEFASINLAMNSEDFKQLPLADKRALRDTAFCGFEGAVKGIIGLFPPDRAFHIYCNLSEEYAERCVKLYNLLRASDLDFKRRCFAISFADDERTPPLQAADMFAYCVRADYENRDDQQPIVKQIHSILTRRITAKKWFVFRRGQAVLGSGALE